MCKDMECLLSTAQDKLSKKVKIRVGGWLEEYVPSRIQVGSGSMSLVSGFEHFQPRAYLNLGRRRHFLSKMW